MHPQQLRELLKIWFNERLRIDAWTPNLPKAVLNASRPPSVGVADTASELDVGADPDITNPTAVCAITYQFIYRFPGELKYEQIGVGKAEKLLLSLLHQLQLAPMRGLHKDIRRIRATGSLLATKPTQENTYWALVFEIRTNTVFDVYPHDLIVSAPEFQA